jgi:tetratricopeptide (TPR) repeat protein
MVAKDALEVSPPRTGIWLVGLVVVALGGGFLAGWVHRHGVLEHEAAAALARARAAADEEKRAARVVEVETVLARALDDAFAWRLRRRHDSFLGRALARAAGVDDASDPAQRGDEVLDEAVERLAARVAGLPPLPALAGALDDWIALEHARLHADGARKLTALANAVDPDPRRLELRALLGRASAGRLRELADAADVRRDPAPTLALLVKALAAVGLADVAVRFGARASAEHPDDYPLRIGLADLLAERGPAQRAAAHTEYVAALALRPASARAWTHLGWLLAARSEDSDAALATLEAATRRVPYQAAAIYVRGLALARASHESEAYMVLLQALAADPRCAPAQAALGELLIGRDAYDPRPIATPRDLPPMDEQGWRDQLERSKEACEQSLRLFDTPEGRGGLAAVLRAQGDVAGAIALLEEGVLRHPDDSTLRGQFAAVLLAAGRRGDALAQWREAIRLDEWNAAAADACARELANGADPRLRRPGQAVEHAQRACEVDPEDAAPHRTLGIALYRSGEFGRCILELELASRIAREGAALDLCFLAMAKQQLGESDTAREYFRQAESLGDVPDPEYERTRDEAAELLGLMRSGK